MSVIPHASPIDAARDLQGLRRAACLATADPAAPVRTTRELARTLQVTRAHAGDLLRELERAGLLDAELIGGGRLGYRRRVTSAG